MNNARLYVAVAGMYALAGMAWLLYAGLWLASLGLMLYPLGVWTGVVQVLPGRENLIAVPVVIGAILLVGAQWVRVTIVRGLTDEARLEEQFAKSLKR